MKKILKQIIMYDRLYPLISKTSLYKIFKKLYGQAAVRFHGNPANDFFVIGVT
jgi:hypothetical protein